MGVAATPSEWEAVAQVGVQERAGAGQGPGGQQGAALHPGPRQVQGDMLLVPPAPAR